MATLSTPESLETGTVNRIAHLLPPIAEPTARPPERPQRAEARREPVPWLTILRFALNTVVLGLCVVGVLALVFALLTPVVFATLILLAVGFLPLMAVILGVFATEEMDSAGAPR
jgi:hypothetical protein